MLKRKKIIAGQSAASQNQASSSSASQAASRWSRQGKRRQSSTPPPPPSPPSPPPRQGPSRRPIRREDTQEPQASSDNEGDQPVPKPRTRLEQLKEYQDLAPFAAQVLQDASPSHSNVTSSLAAAISSYSQGFYAQRGSLRREPLKKPRGRNCVKAEAEEVSEDELDEAATAASDADSQSEESYRDDEQSQDESSEDGGVGRRRARTSQTRERRQRRQSTTSSSRCNMTGAFDESAMFVLCAFVEELTKHQLGDHGQHAIEQRQRVTRR